MDQSNDQLNEFAQETQKKFTTTKKNSERYVLIMFTISIIIGLIASYFFYINIYASNSPAGAYILIFVGLGIIIGFVFYRFIGAIIGGIIGFLLPVVLIFIFIVGIFSYIGARLDMQINLKKQELEIENEPNNPELWNNKGYIYASHDKFVEAIDCFEKSLTIDPTFEIARINRDIAQKKKSIK